VYGVSVCISIGFDDSMGTFIRASFPPGTVLVMKLRVREELYWRKLVNEHYAYM